MWIKSRQYFQSTTQDRSYDLSSRVTRCYVFVPGMRQLSYNLIARSVRLLLNAITKAPDGLDLSPEFAKFLSQPPDMGIYSASIKSRLVSPDIG